MPQYLVAVHHPDDYDPSVEDETMGRDIDIAVTAKHQPEENGHALHQHHDAQSN